MNSINKIQPEPLDLPGGHRSAPAEEHEALLERFRRATVRALLIATPDSPALGPWRRFFTPASDVVVASTRQEASGRAHEFDIVIDCGSTELMQAIQAFQDFFSLLRPGGAHVIDGWGHLRIDASRECMFDGAAADDLDSVEILSGRCVLQKRAVSKDATASRTILQLEARLAQKSRDADIARVLHQAKVAEIHASTSWRVTRPLRWVGRQVLVIKKIIRRWSAMSRQYGGALGVARQGMKVLQRSGWSGLSGVMRVVGDPSQSYRLWVQCYDTLDEEARARMQAVQALWRRRPLITVLMPTYNSSPVWLAQAIESVQAQVYANWELCIADDASPDASCREVLERYSAMDARIKVVYREHNGHISAASNSALALASGEWTALLDHDDLLSPQALFRIAEAIQDHPEVRLMYSDEDKIDEAGHRFGAYFKPDWNVDLFYSQNMFSHLGVFHTALMREAGGFRQGMEGSQDYDLVLRCIERLRPSQIHHIPRVLYHWRVHVESTAGSADAKPYAQLAGERALNEHFQRRGVRGTVEFARHGYRARYAMPDVAPRVSLIIPTRNAAALVKQCIDSIVTLTTYENYEVILVDNGSDAPEAVAYFAELASRPGFRVVRDDGEFNYSALNNRAVAMATGELVALINNDIEVMSPDWLLEMVSLALQPGVGAVGARLWYPDGTLQHGGIVMGVGGIASHSHKRLAAGDPGYAGRAALIQSFSAVTAACLVVRKDIYQAAGGLDEKHLKIAYNDVDFCLRLREMGLRNVWTPYAELIHHESATRGSDETPAQKARFESESACMRERWGALIARDPAYSPNLTLAADDYGLAWPPRLDPL